MNSVALQVISKPMVERIIEAGCLYFGTTENELRQKNSSYDIVYYRKIIYTLIRENCRLSYARIAARFGFSDHGHILRCVDEIQSHRNFYTQTRHDLEKVLFISNNIDAVIPRN